MVQKLDDGLEQIRSFDGWLSQQTHRIRHSPRPTLQDYADLGWAILGKLQEMGHDAGGDMSKWREEEGSTKASA